LEVDMQRKTLPVAVLVAFCALLCGCTGKHEIVSAGLAGYTLKEWVEFSPPRPPQNPLEVSVLKAASTRRTVAGRDADIYFVVEEPPALYVAVVGKTANPYRFAEKDVTRYRVIGGKIAAKAPKKSEIFPDVEFERAVLRAASMAGGDDTVLLYDDTIHPVSLYSELAGKCAVKVSVFDAGVTGGKPLATKIVNRCFRER
jgi:hypothetical protein